tara:strand:+ start:51 stop:326 length:276 start_codon:yes stop_codon:yes gene_type:complete
MNIFQRMQENLFGISRQVSVETFDEHAVHLQSLRDGTLQRVFRDEHCPNCEHYDPETGDFKEIVDVNGKKTCIYGQTSDILGQCWNYGDRE